MDLQNKISTQATYDEVMAYLNTFDEVDDMLLDFLNDSKPQIKIIGVDKENSYDSFLQIFDEAGLS